MKKSKLAIILVSLTLALMLNGCVENSDSEFSQVDGVSNSNTTEIAATRIIHSVEKPKEEIKSMSVYAKSEFNFIEGMVGTITTYTSAEKDENDEFMWDDGHIFAVEVFDGKNYYYLFEPQRVQLGTIEYKIFKDKDNIVRIITDLVTQAGITDHIYEFKYDTKTSKGEFYENIFHSFDNINELKTSK
ncbi:MAG: hypothetical protein RSD67_07920 [Oscillospiraceae bacterium]